MGETKTEAVVATAVLCTKVVVVGDGVDIRGRTTTTSEGVVRVRATVEVNID